MWLCGKESALIMQETWVPFLGWEDPLGEGNGNPLRYSPLGNPVDRAACGLGAHEVEKEYDRTTTKQQYCIPRTYMAHQLHINLRIHSTIHPQKIKNRD